MNLKRTIRLPVEDDLTREVKRLDLVLILYRKKTVGEHLNANLITFPRLMYPYL